MLKKAFGSRGQEQEQEREWERESLDLGTMGFRNQHLTCMEMRLRSIKM